LKEDGRWQQAIFIIVNIKTIKLDISQPEQSNSRCEIDITNLNLIAVLLQNTNRGHFPRFLLS
jgi:hypothetical protein